MDFKKLTAPCGLDCFNCPLFLAKEDKELRARIAKNLDISFERVLCQGCRNERGKIRFMDMTEPCLVYKCIEQKGIEFCSDCSDFPCDCLHPYADRASEVPHNIKVFNLCLIKKIGLEIWAKTKAESVRSTYFKDKWKI